MSILNSLGIFVGILFFLWMVNKLEDKIDHLYKKVEEIERKINK